MKRTDMNLQDAARVAQLSPDTCPLTPAWLPAVSARSQASGQALIEVCVGLIAIMALVAGMIQIGHLAKVHTDTMVEARKEAGAFAVADFPFVAPPKYISEWEAGDDEKRHTADDQSSDGDAFALKNIIVGKAVSQADEWEHMEEKPNGINDLRYAGNPAVVFGMVKGEASESCDLLPAARKLFYNAESIDVEHKVWTTWTKGLY